MPQEFITLATSARRVDLGERQIRAEEIPLMVNANIVFTTSTAYTLTDADHGKLLDFTSGSTVTVSVGDALRDDFYCGISQGGPGQVTIAATGSATLIEPDSQFKTEKRYVLLSIVAFRDNVFRIYGRTAA